MRKGIAVAGTMVVDHIKAVDTYPQSGMLANITQASRAVGGCVPNTLMDLARMGGGIPLRAFGRVGMDDGGRYLLDCLGRAGVDTSGVKRTEGADTSFSDAICALDTGERTFFHHRGGNALFSPEDAPPERLRCDILHIGYLLLLDRFDAPDKACGTVMARYLRDVQRQGIRTSIDVASSAAGNFAQTVIPALRYCDYAIMNELEAGAVSGLPARDGGGRLIPGNIRRALERFMALGVRRRAVIHCPEGGFCLDAREGYVQAPSLRLPPAWIKGSVGAGDAFCAGCLHALYQGGGAEDMLRYAAAAAAASLSAADAVSGMRGEAELRQMMKAWEWRTL